MTAPRCSTLSTRDEPLPGTATRVGGWVCLEHPSPWGRDILDGTAFGSRLTAALKAKTEAAGIRLMLIRRYGRQTPQAGRRRVYLAQSHPGRTRCTELTVRAPEDLLDMDLSFATPGDSDDAASGWPGTPVTYPVTLVCTHGKRDLCCAIDGRPIAAALAGADASWSEHVWECSHTGGHRFAPSMIVLPAGYSYGRVGAADARAAVEFAEAGRLSRRGLRGRTCWAPGAQVAELAVREEAGLWRLGGLTVEPAPLPRTGATSPDAHIVRHSDGRRWRVAVRVEDRSPRATSCGGGPKPVQVARALTVRELPAEGL